jgi:hypothetical protein
VGSSGCGCGCWCGRWCWCGGVRVKHGLKCLFVEWLVFCDVASGGGGRSAAADNDVALVGWLLGCWRRCFVCVSASFCFSFQAALPRFHSWLFCFLFPWTLVLLLSFDAVLLFISPSFYPRSNIHADAPPFCFQWPGAWTMGNLARPGYPATTDGMWPYT